MNKIVFKKGESVTIGFLLNSEYDMSRIQSASAWVGGKKFALATIDHMLRCNLASDDTHKLSGNYKLILWIDDSMLGVKKTYAADIEISTNNSNDNNDSTNKGYDFVFNITINETVIQAGDILYNYVKGKDGVKGTTDYNELTNKPDLSVYQTVTDNTLETIEKDIVPAINEVNSIAKGANQALSFDNYQAVIVAMLVSGLKEGQNLYVDTLDMPDLWIKTVEVTSVAYTYTTDDQFITDILAGVQIGYYKLALLETQKVDLTNYYTKDETDQAIEDYAEPLRTTDQNYVSDAELEVLQETSGTNTGDETQDTIGDLIELTELETVTDTTKIAASDSAFLKWFSGATLKTFLSLTFAKISDYFSKTESDRRYLIQEGGTIFNPAKWFTPTGAFSSIGINVTTTGGQLTSEMIGAKIGVGTDRRIILTVPTSNTCTVDAAFNQDYISQSAGNWGVYNKLIVFDQYGLKLFYSNSSSSAAVLAYDSLSVPLFIKVLQNIRIGSDDIQLKSAYRFLMSSDSNYTSTKDLGLRRLSAGIWEIFDGVTNGALRDLKLRSLFADKIILNALNIAPSSATDTGTIGEVRITADYIYVCTATNTWKRTLIETW